jgi:hypothetical protein
MCRTNRAKRPLTTCSLMKGPRVSAFCRIRKSSFFSLLYLITQCAQKVCAVFYVHIIYKMTEYRLLKYTPGLGYNSI